MNSLRSQETPERVFCFKHGIADNVLNHITARFDLWRDLVDHMFEMVLGYFFGFGNRVTAYAPPENYFTMLAAARAFDPADSAQQNVT